MHAGSRYQGYARLARGYTQQELEDLALVGRDTVDMYENYRLKPGRLTRARLSRALEIDEALLFPERADDAATA